MIKLCGRENMKKIAKFLLAVVSFAPVAAFGAGPVATTAGSNLTAYNGNMGSVAGNQWNNATNARGNIPVAKADYGNCNALMLRCASPKCSGGGCSDLEVAKSIATGCVNSNSTCKKHGDALIAFIAGQLVSDSVAAANKQASDAAAAQAQSAEQIAQMQQQMQMQMQQMQEQNNAQIASLQSALEESQRATTEAVNAAAQAAAQQTVSIAPVVDAGTGLTTTQEVAAKSGVSEDVITRATISGQILTSMDGVESSLNALKTTMRDVFRYAQCNEVNGNNCQGPKRVKKFREVARTFIDPYYAVERNLESALERAQSVGVDMGNIYMFFSGSCHRWAEFICRYATEELPKYSSTSCVDGISKPDKANGIIGKGLACSKDMIAPPEDVVGCVVNKNLDNTNYDDFNQRVLNPENTDDGSIRVGCADSFGSVFKHRRGNGSGSSNSIDIELLEIMINQDEAGNEYGKKNCSEGSGSSCYCGPTEGGGQAQLANLKKIVLAKNLGKNCCSSSDTLGTCTNDCSDMDIDVAYVSPTLAMCDVHAWNAGFKDNTAMNSSSENQELAKQTLGLKATVITQQMYKIYSTLDSMIRQVKILLEKEVLKSNLQVAGGSAGDSDGGSADKVEFENCNKGEDSAVLSCLNRNVAKYEPFVSKGNRRNDVLKAMFRDQEVLNRYASDDPNKKVVSSCSEKMDKNTMGTCYNDIIAGINKLSKKIQKESRGSNGGGLTFTLGGVQQ